MEKEDYQGDILAQGVPVDGPVVWGQDRAETRTSPPPSFCAERYYSF